MPISKQYLRYQPAGAPFGLIGSTNGQIVWLDWKGRRDRFVAVSACENVIIWDTKTSDQVKLLAGDKAAACTVLAQYGPSSMLAAGYADGSIRLFNYETGELRVTFNGHRSGVSCLCFDGRGMRLASGGKDTEIVVWDTVAESGLFRLKGHKNVVTNVQFMVERPDVLISSSRDTYIKFWDLHTQHCFKTLVGHRSEIWDFIYSDVLQLLVTGTSDGSLKCWAVQFNADTNSATGGNQNSKSNERQLDSDVEQDNAEEDEDEDVETANEDESLLSVVRLGSIMRKSVSRLQCLTLDSTEKFMCCHGSDAMVECYRLRNQDEAREALQRRLKRERKKLKRAHAGKDEPEVELNLDLTLSDQIECYEPFKAYGKVKYCSIVAEDQGCKVVALLGSNALQVFSRSSPTTFESTATIMMQGHRTDVRTTNFSSDNFFLLTASADCIKVWNRTTLRPIATINENCGYALCSLFVPGDKSCLVGSKEGNLHIYDIGAAQELECVRASDDAKAIWSMDLYPNKNGFVTGSEDKLVKFWDFEFVSLTERGSAKRLSVIHRRTLQMDEAVLAVRIAPNNKLIAVALTDSTVKVFFVDTLKHFLTLYGHKFPVLCMDISSDSTLIATGSSDKNIKIWGLDFGNCHRSIFAHDDSITTLRFVPKTHYLFSGSKDRTVKQWDCDNFEKIATLNGHQGEVWSLAVSPNGKFVVSASHDKSLRLWERAQDLMVLEEEKELEREELFEKHEFAGDEQVVAGESNKETGLAGKKTVETVKATELILEAVDVHKEEAAARREYESQLSVAKKHNTEPPQPPVPNPIMARFQTTCPDRFVLETLQRVRPSELEEALLSLPFNYVEDLLSILSELLTNGYAFELLLRCVTFLTRIHFGQITSSSALLPVIDKLRKLTVSKAKEFKDIVGFNVAGLRYLQSKVEEAEEVSLFSEAIAAKQDRRRKKAKRAAKDQPLNQIEVPVLRLT